MFSTNDVTRVYDTILSTPGMNENVKINERVSRKNVLLLSSVIDRGLRAKDDEKTPSLLKSAPEESLQELRRFAEICLEKAGLVELNQKLNGFGENK